MGRTGTLALLGVLLSVASGCGTVLNFVAGTEEGERSLIYGGVRVEALVVGHMFSGDNVHGLNVFWMALFTLFDLPLTLAADTLTLPVTVGIELFGSPGKTEEKEPDRSLEPERNAASGTPAELVSG